MRCTIDLRGAEVAVFLAWLVSADGQESQTRLLRARALGAIPQLLAAVRQLNEQRAGGSDRSADFRMGPVGLCANSLATDPAWDDIRSLARQFLLTKPGDWRQPLPRPVRPRTGDH
ncbi:DUF2397 family protein [Streptomyces monashensis]|uniref:Uncharacterized protein n=1 Tax=Streptomyces monashensis TaxID=1678012 RepID=A0A1S2QQ33_9ACTN|nr:DUF2397 family protein [Streptomyces monashensis]OIK07723.1 hypothetical protein BIV23_01705 [Streptomyces monashensis]